MLRKPANIVIVVILIPGAVWLFWKPTPPPAKTAEAPKDAAPSVPKPVFSPPVAAPKLAPTATKTENSKPDPIKPSSDPQAELNTSISDIIGLLQSGDILTAFNRYVPPDILAQMPPEEKTMMEQQLPAEMSRPEAQQGIQMMVTVLQGMQTQTPTPNDAGDRATYQVSDPTGQDTRVQPFSFRKIDGKWYVDPDSMKGM